jgi:chromosome segregation ATPase
MNRNDLEEQLKLLKQSMSDNEIRDSEIKSKLRIILDEKKEYATELRSKVKRVTQGKELLKMSPDELAMQRVKKAREQGKKAKEQAKIAKRKAEILAQEKAFVVLGQCDIGNTVYHREVWNTKTSSGNVLADMAFGAATKETFIITYEAVVESFLGNKVKTIINDYKIQQTVGGGFLNQRTYRKYDIASHADKYIGKTQFYDKARCS